MGKGDYLIVDLTSLGDITEVPKQGEKGLYERIEGADVPIMIYHSNVDSFDCPSQFSVPRFREGKIIFSLIPGAILSITQDDMVASEH